MKSKMKLIKNIIHIPTLVFLSGCSVFGIRNEETPKYTVILNFENKEIRQYEPHIIATTEVEGTFEESQNKGFKILAAYIFGENEKDSKIAMTAPVIMNPEINRSEKIAMTAPVVQSPTKTGWAMNFTMPSQYKDISSLPKPKDARIRFKQEASKTVAVIKFTGFWSEEKIKKMGEQLSLWLLEQKASYVMISQPMFAGYDPPWTLPFLRRNEVMIELQKR